MQKIKPASHGVMAVLIIGALFLKLVPAVFAGFLVYTLTQKVSDVLLNVINDRFSTHAKAVALALVIFAVLAIFGGLGIATTNFVKSKDGLPWLIANMADILEKVRLSVPAVLQEYIPATVAELNTAVVAMLREHSATLSAVGVETLKSSALLLLALVAGAMVSWNKFAAPDQYLPLAGALRERFANLTTSFEKVVFAQVKISAVNSILTGIYLLGVLPLFGINLPLAKTLVGITFVAGLLPVIGNLISNAVIVVVSLGVGPQIAVASLAFLVGVHKLEYFLNARIIGHDIDAAAWELIITMIVMERLFGVPGLVTAPVVYAYLKRELKQASLIGMKLDVPQPLFTVAAEPEESPNGVSLSKAIDSAVVLPEPSQAPAVEPVTDSEPASPPLEVTEGSAAIVVSTSGDAQAPVAEEQPEPSVGDSDEQLEEPPAPTPPPPASGGYGKFGKNRKG